MTESERPPKSAPEQPELEPLPVSTPQIIVGGIVLWVVALLTTLVVPSLHAADRSWWPWTCVTGIALGLFGYTYVRRGRGNAHDAR